MLEWQPDIDHYVKISSEYFKLLGITHGRNMENKPLQNTWFLITLALMSMAGLVGTDVYLPALPEIGQALHQSSDAMQLTLGVYLFGLGIGQLVLGPLTDRFGRKGILLLSMALYCLASIACALSLSYFQMVLFRGIQAFGACGGLVIGRAIVADKYKPQEAGKVFATIFPFVGMSPAISPAIGGFIAYYLGWRADFIFIGLFALAILCLAYFFIPETLPTKNKKPLRIATIISTYPGILTNRQFIYYTIAPCIAYIAFFAYMAQSPFIFHAQGFSERAIGLFYITLSLAYVAGNITGKKALANRTLNDVLKQGYKYFLGGACCLLLYSSMEFPLIFIVASISIMTFANGILIPLGTAGVVSSFREKAGYASGLLGFFQLGIAGLTSSCIGAISGNDVWRLAEFIFAATVVSMVARRVFSPESQVETAPLS